MNSIAPSVTVSLIEEPISCVERISAFTPAQIRESISCWVARDRMDLAEALVVAGLALYPSSEDILAIGALVFEVGQDWAQAQKCLEQLLEVQGALTTGESWYHLVRVMRCREAYFPAIHTVRQGLARHPDHAGLQHEHRELGELLESTALETPTQAVAC